MLTSKIIEGKRLQYSKETFNRQSDFKEVHLGLSE
jgi:hypothetical protein